MNPVPGTPAAPIADIVAEDCIGQYAPRSNSAVRPDFGLAQQLHTRFDDGVFARGHVRIDQHRLRQLDSDAAIHQLAPFALTEYAVDFRKIGAGIAAQHFARIGGDLRQHRLAFGVQYADGIG